MNKRITIKLIFILVFCIVCIGKTFSQYQKFEAIFIYNICRYVEWPSTKNSGNFIIGVVGNDNIINELNTVAKNRKIGGKNIEIKKLSDIYSPENYHVLFIPEKKEEQLIAFKKSGKNSNTLIITRTNNGLAKGAAINFLIKQEKLKFELKKANLQSQGLLLSTELEQLAYRVL